MVSGSESPSSHGEQFLTESQLRFFSMSKYASFQRQLNIYGFDRFLDGPDRGAYFHPLFLRGSPHATDHMVRRKIKGLSSKKMRSISSQPDFYAESRAQDQFFRSSLAKRTSSCSHTPAPAPAPTLSKMTSSPVSVVSALNDVVSADMMSIFQLNHLNYETSSLCIPSVFDLKKAPLKLPSEWIEPNEIPGLAEKASPSSAVSQDNLDPIPLDRLDEFSVSLHDKVLLKDLLPEHFDAIFQ